MAGRGILTERYDNQELFQFKVLCIDGGHLISTVVANRVGSFLTNIFTSSVDEDDILQ